jgi:hypothetical protein
VDIHAIASAFRSVMMPSAGDRGASMTIHLNILLGLAFDCTWLYLGNETAPPGDISSLPWLRMLSDLVGVSGDIEGLCVAK